MIGIALIDNKKPANNIGEFATSGEVGHIRQMCSIRSQGLFEVSLALPSSFIMSLLHSARWMKGRLSGSWQVNTSIHFPLSGWWKNPSLFIRLSGPFAVFRQTGSGGGVRPWNIASRAASGGRGALYWIMLPSSVGHHRFLGRFFADVDIADIEFSVLRTTYIVLLVYEMGFDLGAT